jgi:1-acyl-sn-glycerol-3-phosphate acyltransferase
MPEPARGEPVLSYAPRAEPRLPPWLVQNRNFLLLWAAYGVSAVGDHLSEMALIKERGGFARTDITRVQALLTFGFFLPFVVFGPLAGWWADRFSRKWTMIATDLVRAGLMSSLVLTVPLLDAHAWGDYSIVLPIFAAGLFATFFSPCRQAMVPTLIRDDQLVRANAMISAMGTIGAIFSAWLGGVLVELSVAGYFKLHWNYFLDALSFLGSAVLLSGIAMGRARVTPHAPLQGVWTPLIQGFRYVGRHRRVLQLILVSTVFWGVAGVVISVVPALVKAVFGGRFSDAGLYRGLIGAGLAVGAAVMTIIGPTMPLRLRVLGGLAGSAFWLLALDAAYIWRLGKLATGLSLFAMGGAGAALLVTVMASIQRFVPDSHRGRVFGVSDTATMAAMAVATGLLGVPHIPNLDRYVPYLLGIGGLLMLISTWRAWREYRRDDPHPAALSLLWQIEVFYARYWLGVERVGPCTVPRSGPVIIAANHTAGVDPLGILATCTHRVTSFLVEESYYRAPVLGWFQRLIGCVPVDRANPGKSSLSGCLRLLKEGGCLGIFPEGTFRGPEEPPPEPKAGVGLLALRTGAAVIPCHISGTVYSPAPLRALLSRHKMRIRYGRPVDLSALRGREQERDAVRQAGELIMNRVRELGAGANAGDP